MLKKMSKSVQVKSRQRLDHWLIGRVVGMEVEYIEESWQNLAIVVAIGGTHHFLHLLPVGSPLGFVLGHQVA